MVLARRHRNEPASRLEDDPRLSARARKRLAGGLEMLRIGNGI
jgi:hypothetical protein